MDKVKEFKKSIKEISFENDYVEITFKNGSYYILKKDGSQTFGNVKLSQDTMAEARKKPWFKYYSFIARLKIKLSVFFYKLSKYFNN